METDSKTLTQVPSSRAAGSSRHLLWATAAVVGVVGAVIAAIALRNASGHSRPVVASASAEPAAVACLGHIEPENGVVTIAARSLMGQPSIVSELRVKEGDHVQAGHVIALLNSKDQLEAAWQEAEARTVLARRQLAQVQVGAKTGELAAQEAEIARARAEVANAEIENRRVEALFRERIASQSSLDASRTDLETKRQLLQQASEKLRALAEVRETDVNTAKAQVEAAAADALRARAEYEQAVIRSPLNARVIKIHTWPGEEVGSRGIMELAQTERMYAIAEVLENDVPRLKIGSKAVISGESLAQPVQGIVEQVGMKVAGSTIINTDPAQFADTRVVEVKVRIQEPQRVQDIIHAQVRVVFQP